MHGTATPGARTGVAEIFGMRSGAVRGALVLVGASSWAIDIYASWGAASWWQWVMIVASLVILCAAGTAVVAIAEDPIPRRSSMVIVAITAAGVGVGLFGLTTPLINVMQTGPTVGLSVIIFAFLAVRGRVRDAWAGSAVVTVVAGVWSAVTGLGPGYGIMLTVAGYAVMIMGSLFAVMLRPMATSILALRESRARQFADDAATRAAADVRRVAEEGFARRARPLLEAVVRGDDFDNRDVATARRVEAALRDGIRARSLDTPEIRDAVWHARRAGRTVTLLDDGGLDDLDDADRRGVLDALTAALIVELRTPRSTGESQRVVVRILPSGRDAVAVITVAGQPRREFGLDRRT